jgi:hypothetical protein
MKCILFADEAQCHRDGITNASNSRSWSHDSLHEVVQSTFKHRLSVYVWCRIDGIIEGRLTAASDTSWKMNQHHLQNIPLQTRRRSASALPESK